MIFIFFRGEAQSCGNGDLGPSLGVLWVWEFLSGHLLDIDLIKRGFGVEVMVSLDGFN